MTQSKCPICGCEQFYIKDPEDPFEIYEFTCPEGTPELSPEASESDVPPIEHDTEAYCNKCSWHGKFETLSGGGNK